MNNKYTPAPIDLSDQKIPEGLNELIEDLAKNVHENWAALRIKQGWKYGTKRDDDRKTHPSLVPYEQLPESEKEYDRHTALQTIKFIAKRGYTIERK